MENKNYLYSNYINMARECITNKEDLKALKFYKKAYDMPIGKEDIELLIDMALLYDKIGLKDYAEKRYKEVLKIDNKCANAYYGLGVLYDEKEDFDNAIKYYKEAIKYNPSYDKAYFFLANIYDEKGEKDLAIENYKKVIKINSNDLWAYVNIACIYEELNRDEEGIKYLKKALEIDKFNYKVLYNMGVSLKKLKKIDDAKKFYNLSIKENKEYPYSYLNLAVIFKEEGDYNKAINILNEGIDNTNKDFLYYHRGCIYAKLKENEKALRDINKSIELNDFFIEYSKNDKDLEELYKYISNKNNK